MNNLKRKQIEDLASINDKNCISIFIPTHQKGEHSLKGTDSLVFKQQVKNVENLLREDSLEDTQIDKFLKPLYDLIEDKSFWRKQSEGLAVFLSEKVFEKFRLPISFSSEFNISNSFFLKPLMVLFEKNTRFYLLALEQDKVQLYLVTEQEFNEISLPVGTPSHLEEAVGFDYEEKTLQARSQQQGVNSSVFHGQGEGKEDRKNEILKFFREINKGVTSVLTDEKLPLVLAGLDYLLPIYKKANSYEHLSDVHLSINPFGLKPKELWQKSLEKMEPIFEKAIEEKKAQFQQFHNTSKTSKTLSEILPAAFSGKIDTLFIEKDFEMVGIYEPEKDKLHRGLKKMPQNVSLTNLVAIQVFLKGGDVYLMDKEQLPLEISEIGSLNRY